MNTRQHRWELSEEGRGFNAVEMVSRMGLRGRRGHSIPLVVRNTLPTIISFDVQRRARRNSLVAANYKTASA
jgi:hypothetical protein